MLVQILGVRNHRTAVADLQFLVIGLRKIKLPVILHTGSQLRFAWLTVFRKLCQSLDIIILGLVRQEQIPVIIRFLEGFDSHYQCGG